jgi:pimeloyl-ACP methyl ester carboxylesterase
MQFLDKAVSQPFQRAQAVHGRVSKKLMSAPPRPHMTSNAQKQRTAQKHLTANMWQAKYSVGRYPTEAWGMQSPQPRMQVLVLPGNPGSACWYRVFMQQLFAAFNGSADVMAVSHVGHDCENISSGAVWGLDCQVQHKVELLQELTTPGRPPLVVLAHSIGSFITLQVGPSS